MGDRRPGLIAHTRILSRMRHRLALVTGAAVLLAACSPAPAATSSASEAPPAAQPTTTTSPSADAEVSATASPSADPVPLAWNALDVDVAPAAREDHTWTVGDDGRTAYLFGGRDGAQAYADLWAFDLGSDTWSQLEPGAGPAARFGHEAAWVNGVGLVLFAGQAGTTFFNDLWAFDPEAGIWRQLPSGATTPLARYGTCAAVGPDGRLWISHGFTSDGTRFADTWAYDFDVGGWIDETPEGERPVERCLHGCWWTGDAALTLYAGQTTGVTALGDRWSLGTDGWSRVDGALPPERNLYARTRIGDATLVFGGQALDGTYLGDLWQLADESPDATPLTASGGPTRAGAELVTDAESGRVLLFGGRDADGAHGDLWALTGSEVAGG